jgi:antitoxin component YwqK of YwqJK toxin-antitoxin module
MKTKLIIITTFFISNIVFAQTDNCKTKKEYFPSGKVKLEGCEKKGKREGQWLEYEEYNGKYYLRFIWTYKNGLKDGPYKALHENQKPEAIGSWEKGAIVDTLKLYKDNGDLDEIQVWVADKGGKSSHTVYQKKIYKNPKPDNTVESIDGKNYIWQHGERYELHQNKPK